MMTERLLPFPSLLPQVDFTCYRPFQYYLKREISTSELPLELCGVDTRKCMSQIHFDGG
jgi:hypothetical protein